MQKGFTAVFILIGILIVILISCGAYYLGKRTVLNSQTQTTPQSTDTSQIINPTARPDQGLQPQLKQSASLTLSSNLKTYNDITYNYTIQYPNTWILTQDKDSEGYPRVKLTGTNSTKAAFSTRRTLPELYLTIMSPYSTSGGICFNQSCEESGKLSVTIKGKRYDIPIIKGSVNSKFNFYAFQFDIPGKKVSLQGVSEPVQLSAYASFKTMEEGQAIADILSTLSY